MEGTGVLIDCTRGVGDLMTDYLLRCWSMR